MKTIYKYSIVDYSGQDFQMPKGSLVRHFGMQDGVATFWVEVESSNQFEQRYFLVHGTGHEINASEVYRGSCQDGPFVWHLYELL